MRRAVRAEVVLEQYTGSNSQALLAEISSDPTMNGLAEFTNVNESDGVLTFHGSFGGGNRAGYQEDDFRVETGQWLEWQYGWMTILDNDYVTERMIFKE